MAWTTKHYMEVIEESVKHSKNLTDWNIEALIKELLWATCEGINSEKITKTEREDLVFRELANRIKELYQDDKATQVKVYRKLINLINEQELCANPTYSPAGRNKFYSHAERNKALRAFEDAMKVRTIIPDILLP